MTRLIPRHGLIVVQVDEQGERKTASGLVIPQNSALAYAQATVIEVSRGNPEGPGDRTDTDDLKPGMRVLVKLGQKVDLGKTALSAMPFATEDQKNMYLLNQHDIFAIIEGDAPKLTLAD